MSLESQIFSALQALVGGRVFPDVAPNNTMRPYVTYQAVGGGSINFLEGGPVGKRNARVQVNVWADTRVLASQIGDQVEDALRGAAALQTEALGAGVSLHEPDTGLRGHMQDFSFWY